MRIGIVDQSASGWVAASIYSRMILRSLQSAAAESQVELFFLTGSESDQQPPNSTLLRMTAADYLPGEKQFRNLFGLAEKSQAFRGEVRLRRIFGLASKSDLFAVAREHKLDVLLPLLDLPPWQVTAKTIGWIPDFQHVHLPQFFNRHDLERRDLTYKRLAQHASVVMLSSEAARRDFVNFAPEEAAKGRVISFPSLLAFEDLATDPTVTRTKFHLPEKFALVANQFWAHKNHRLVVEALETLQRQKLRVPVVMTGLPADHRDPANKTFSALLQSIASANLSGQIMILGLVPYDDLVNLMRTAALIIQPSRFEGWSTIVQDAVALGRPIVCSDIAVHREQVPNALGFFPTDRPDVLAELLESKWKQLSPGPDKIIEEKSLASERAFSGRHGVSLLNLCAEVATL